MKQDSYRHGCPDSPFGHTSFQLVMLLGLLQLSSSQDSQWPGECDGKYRYKTLIAAVTEVADW